MHSVTNQRGTTDRAAWEREAAARPALARLVAIPVTEFGTTFWGSHALLTRADSLDDIGAELFSAAAVDELIAHRGLRTPFIRMANEGQVLPAIRFTASGGFGAEVSDQVDSVKVFSEFAAGSTIVLQGLHRTWAPITDFSRQLVADLGHPVQVNAYVTPAQSRGFDPHYDVHDVFVVQIAGEKRWRIHEPALVNPLPSEPWSTVRAEVERRALGVPIIDETLGPGDVLYLPRGWIHSATALGGTSVHLTIGVAALTRRDIVDLLLESIDSHDLRASLPLGAGGADAEMLGPDIAETVRALSTALQRPGVARAVAERVGARVRTSIRPEPVEPLAALDAVGEVSGATVVRWRHGIPTRLTTGTNTVTLRLDGASVSFPREAESALTTLRNGGPVATSDLPGLDLDSAIVVVRRLLREAVLTVVFPENRSGVGLMVSPQGDGGRARG